MAGEKNFDAPLNEPVTAPGFITLPRWAQWLTRVNAIANANVDYGTTAQRPTALLWIGRRFYDTTLNKPVYVSAVKPAVWRDAMSNIV